MVIPIRAVLLVAAALVTTSSGADAPMAMPVKGEAFAAQLVRIDPGGVIQFQVNNKIRSMPAGDLVSWGNLPGNVRPEMVVLADGGCLAGEVLRLDAEHLKCLGDLFGEVSLPIAAIRGIVRQWPVDTMARDRLLEEIQSYRERNDLVLLDNGDRLSGILVGPDSAPALDVGRDEILYMRLAGKPEVVPIDLARVQAVALNAALVQNPPDRALAIEIGFRDGSRLDVVDVQNQNDRWTLRANAGITLPLIVNRLLDDNPWNSVVSLRPWGANVVYVSDLEPVGYKHIPFLALPWDYRRDGAVTGGRLRSGQHVYTKGLGMHSSSRLAYDLLGRFDQLAADLAVDASAGGEGSVEFRVYLQLADGQWSPAWQSPVIRGGQAPIPLQLDVQGAQRMALIVDFADYGDVQDYADWLNVRLRVKR